MFVLEGWVKNNQDKITIRISRDKATRNLITCLIIIPLTENFPWGLYEDDLYSSLFISDIYLHKNIFESLNKFLKPTK